MSLRPLRPSRPFARAVRRAGLAVSAALLGLAGPAALRAQAPTFQLKWGAFGTADGQFSNANSIALDSVGSVFITDFGNGRVQKFTADGAFVSRFGSSGTGDGQFRTGNITVNSTNTTTGPVGIAIGSGGVIYVADYGNHRIQKFDSSGGFVAKWGSLGTSDGQFTFPVGVAVDSTGNVWVADYYNHRLQKFTSAGVFLLKVGGTAIGTANGQFNYPIALAVDAADNVYVAEQQGIRIQKFTSAGTFVTKWGTSGTGDGQFANPFGITVDAASNVYVTDSNFSSSARVQKFTSAGVFTAKFGSYGTGDGQFTGPFGLAVNASNQIYVMDQSQNRVQRFAPSLALAVPTNATFRAGQNLDFVATFPTTVTVAGGTPSIALTIGSTTRAANYLSGTGTAALTFRYTIQAGETDTDGIALATSITLNGATITDTTPAAAPTSFTPPSTTGILVDTTAPTVTSINRQTPSGASTSASSLVFRVTFSESVSGVDTSDFTLTTTGTAAAGGITTVSASSGTVIDVSVGPMIGSGTVRLDLKSSGTGIADTGGNAIAAGFTTGQTYTLDRVAPSVSSIARDNPVSATTSAASVTYRVLFSEPVTGVDVADFTMTTTGVVGTNIASLVADTADLTGATYIVTVNSLVGNGSIRLDLKSTGTGITDTLGNAIAAGFVTGDTYNLDSVGPTVSGVTRRTPGTTSTSLTSVTWAVLFNEGVTGVTANSFTLTATGTAAGTIGTVSQDAGDVSGATHTATVGSITGSGTLRLDVKATGTGITDFAGNAITGGAFTTGETYTIIGGITIGTHPLTQSAAAGSAITLSVTATGAAPLAYQWYRNGAAVSGATNSTLAFAAVALADAANYSVLVSNSTGAALSNAATLTVTAAPVIATLSAVSGRVIEFGASATLTPLFTGSGTLTYQWSKNGTALTGQTNAAYTITNAVATDAADYTVTATNNLGNATSSTISVVVATVAGVGNIQIATNSGTRVVGTIDANGVLNGSATATPPGTTVAPAIPRIYAPDDILIDTGATATLTVAASGNPAPTFQWFKNNVAITGATSSSLTIASAATSDSGNYTVTATNSGGTVTSASLGVTVGHITSGGGPISFSTSGGTVIAGNVDSVSGALTGSVTATGGANAAPVVDGITAKSGVMLNQGAGATFSVAASGNPVPTYQWLKDGNAITGATATSFSLVNVQPTDAASYSVRATNSGGNVTSAGVPVTVVSLPSGNGPVSISGGNGTQVGGTLDASGVLTGSVTSGGPNAVVAPKIAGVNTAADLLVSAGGTVTLAAVATGNPAPTYQWKKDGLTLTGATASTFTIASAATADAGNYTVTATNTGGNVTSTSLGLTVGSITTGGGPLNFSTSGGTRIAGNVDGTTGILTGSVTTSGGATALPTVDNISAASGMLLTQGSTATLSIVASGNPVPTYQWLKDGNTLAGATNASLTLTNVQPADAATYTVRATNAGGNVTSAGVPVTVVNIASGSGPVSISGGNGTQVGGTLGANGVLTGSVTAGGPNAVVAPKFAGVTTAADLLVSVGAGATLSAVATGSPTPTLQWTRNGTVIAGATSATYAITNATNAAAGTYVVTATNASGTATSSSLGVTIGQVPTGGGPINFATSGGTQIAGDVDGPTGALTGTVTASGGANAAPTVDGISAQTGVLLNQGASVSFRVSAAGNPVPTYQWLRDGNVIAGATSPTFSLTNAQPTDAALYAVRATNSGGAVTSAGVPVTVVNISGSSGPLTIAGGNGTVVSGTIDASGVLSGGVTSGGVNAGVAPKISGPNTSADLLIEPGATATLAAVATGNPAPAYQWFKNNVAVTGATSATFVITNATAADAGNYDVDATNASGTATSTTLGVTVGKFTAGGGPLNFSTSGGTEIAGTVDATTGVLTGSVTTSGGAPAAPVIDGISAKSGVMLNQGATITFTVAASGNPVPTYQWLKDAAPISGATNASLTLTNAQPADAAQYSVRATNAAGNITSAAVPVTVVNLPSGNGPLTISGGNGTQVAGTLNANGTLTGGVTAGGPNAVVAPKIAGVNTSADLLVELGTTATLAAVATGSPAPAYQWFRGGVTLGGATNSSYTFSNASASDAGNYTVTATNSAGAVTSATLGVTIGKTTTTGGPISFATSGGTQIAGNVDPTTGVLTGSVTTTTGGNVAPVITGLSAKSGVMVTQGSAISFSVVASGNPAPTYQWLRDGAPLPGQTRTTLSLTNVQPSDAALYAVRVNNAGGTVTGEAVPLTVYSLSSTGGLSISGGNGTQVAATLDADGLLTGGVTTGGPAAIVGPRLSGVTNTGTAVVAAGGSLVLSSVATGSPTPTYQWYRDGKLLAGKTSSTLVLTEATFADAAVYNVVATNSRGAAASDFLRVLVSGARGAFAPVVVSVGTTPSTLILDQGTGVTLTVKATGNPLPAFQWLKDGAAIAGQTGAFLPIASAQSADAGRYTVRVTNSGGAVTSDPVAVNVVRLAASGPIEIATDGGTRVTGTVDAATGAITGTVTTGATGAAVPAAAPRILGVSGNPGSLAVEVGATATLTVAATGSPAPAIQWSKDGAVLAGQTSANLTFVNIQPGDAGLYAARLTNANGAATTANLEVTVYATALAGQLSVTTANGTRVSGSVDPATGLFVGTSNVPGSGPGPTPTVDSRLSNLSVRHALRAAETLTTGFVISGAEPRPVLIRAVGPGLAQFSVTGFLARPQLRILRGSEVVATNAGLLQAPNLSAIVSTARDLNAFALDSAGNDAAILATLAVGAYTAEVTGLAGAGGQVLLELYDAGPAAAGTTRLANFSTRLDFAGGETVNFGASISGTTPKRVLIRAVGPTLNTLFGVTPVLPAPVLRVQQGATTLAQNTRWTTAANATEIAAAAASVGAFALGATAADSAVVVTLPAGSYNLQIADAAAGRGAMLLEFYELP